MNYINLNSGESMFHDMLTAYDKNLKSNVPVKITGYHKGTLKPGMILNCGPFSLPDGRISRSTGWFEIVEVKQRKHKGTGEANAFFEAKVKMISNPLRA